MRIGNFVEVNDLGWVMAAETGFTTGKKPDGRDTTHGLDTLGGGDVLPGLAVPIREIFGS